MTRPLPPALTALLDVLVCPQCREGLAPGEGALRCPRGHTSDLARGGHVSLLGGRRARSGDDDAMARARDRFLASGAYGPLRDAVVNLARPALDAGTPRPTVLDIGCGTGWYLAGLLDAVPAARGLGIDTSARSLRFAARAHPRAAAVAADVFAPLPLRDASVDVVLDVFAPRNAEEFARVLRPGGRLVVARPAPDHLHELRAAVPGTVGIDERKEERLRAALGPPFAGAEGDEEREVRFPLPLDPAAAADLLAMTPSARHLGDVDPGDLPSSVTVAVLVGSYHRIP